MNSRRRNSQNQNEWRNWGDHPLIITIGIVLTAIGTIFGVLGYCKADNAPRNADSSSEKTENVTRAPFNTPNLNTSTGDRSFAIYIDKKDESSALLKNLSEKIVSSIKKAKPKKISVIAFGEKDKTLWAVAPEDFYFDWDDSFFSYFSTTKNDSINKLGFYLDKSYIDDKNSSFYQSKCTSIFDLKSRINKDYYKSILIFTDGLCPSSGSEKTEVSLSPEKKMLILLTATLNETYFYSQLQTLKEAFPTAEVVPFVSVEETQILNFLQNGN